MSKKIFELAKELNMGPLDLVEDLKVKGFTTVRNHMSSLSDEEVVKVLELYKKSSVGSGTERSSGTKKVVRKKVVKKETSAQEDIATGESAKTTKTTKTTTAAKIAKGAKVEKTLDTQVDGDKPKIVTRKKATVIRRKSDSDENKITDTKGSVGQDAPAELENHNGIGDAGLQAPENNQTENVETQNIAAKRVGGLRVVAVPEKVTAKAVDNTIDQKLDTAANIPTEPKEKELYKEKVHRFTPIYVPPKAENVEDGNDKTSKVKSASDSLDDDEDDKKKKEEASRKRMGGLATIMSGKKIVSKSQAINQARADGELKSYALSGTGRPLYTTIKRKKLFVGSGDKTNITEVKESKRVLRMHNAITVLDLAKKLKIKLKELVDKALTINFLLKGDDYLGYNLASEMAALYGYRVDNMAFDENEALGKNESDKDADYPLRDPIITIMGHVDHGKTTLLDTIRNTKVAAGEAGGITQHIGAYSVKTSSGKTLTFLDTPGHAAFGAMRQRGANVTDIVVLVVAADDGVMPQTKESIRFCQNADVPVIVAINKMDKEAANPDRIKQALTEFNITPEEWGGDTQFVPISALKGEGIDELLDSIGVLAEVLEPRSNPIGPSEGVVIESKIEQGRGPVATILVQKGTLKKGDSIVVGECFGRARSLMNSHGVQIDSAGPSIPVQIIGLDEAPTPGDIMNTVKNEREAKKIVENRINDRKSVEMVNVTKAKVSLEDFFADAGEAGSVKKELNLIVRSDVQGSFEAIKQSLEALSNDEVQVKLIGGGVGPITENDVALATSAQGFIIGFNMRPVTNARRLAEQNGIDVKTYSIIYELINDISLAMEGLLVPDFVEEFIGRAEVRDTFNVPKVGVIAGSQVIDGKIQIGCKIRLLRDGKIMFDGKLSSLKRFKDDVKEVKNGYECGIGLENYNDVKVGDLFEAYMMIEKKRTLADVANATKEKSSQSEQTI